MRAALRYRDQAVGEAIAETTTNPESRYLLVHALGDAGSLAAQKALIDLYDLPALSEDDRKNVVYALSMVETPVRETTAFLTGLLDDEVHGLQAKYGVGANAFYARERDPKLAADAVDVLKDCLNRATTLPDQLACIRALGNAAHPDVLPILEPYLSSEQPTTLRAAAIDALRRVPRGRVDMFVARALSDAARMVREAAIGVLHYRSPTPTLVYAVRDALLTEPDKVLRQQLVGCAADWVATAPVLRAPLQQLSTSDESEDIRRAAARALDAK